MAIYIIFMWVMFSELDLPDRLKNACVKDYKSSDPTEKLYYLLS